MSCIPFGGVKKSSTDSFKEQGAGAIDFYTRIKTVYVGLLGLKWCGMKFQPLSLLLLLCSLTACDIGRSAKFIAPSNRLVELASHNGFLWTVPGNAVLDGGRSMGPQQNLLYLLVVCPDIGADKKGSGTTFGTVNRYESHWGTRNGKVSVAVVWNRSTDTVTVGQQKFERGAGGVFVIIRRQDGTITTRQLPSPAEDADEKRILRFIQQRLTNDALVASIRLTERK